MPRPLLAHLPWFGILRFGQNLCPAGELTRRRPIIYRS